MKILHVASHTGNIGDNASHMGLYSLINGLGYSFSVQKEEIRKYYKNYNAEDKRHFDKEFLNKTRNCDLVIIGGGNFLEYNKQYSNTGTTINISSEVLSKLDRPVIFSSVGCTLKSTATTKSQYDFKSFLKELKSKNNIYISLRNDGSKTELSSNFKEYSDYIPEILDSGFFFSPEEPNIFSEESYVAVNVTEDQVEEEFSNLTGDDYYRAIAKAVEYIANKIKLKVVFVPHIYSDLKAIGYVLSYVDNILTRSGSIIVAPYWQGDKGANNLFSVYEGSEFVLATRLHANICSLSMGKKVICLPVLARTEYVYNSFMMSDNVASSENLTDSLINKIDLANEGLLAALDRNSSPYRALKDQTLNFYGEALGPFNHRPQG